EGNASLGVEIAASDRKFDSIVAPVGGGGLTSGIIQGLHKGGGTAQVFAVEPLIANDAARSIKAGRLIVNDAEPATIADGVRTISLGAHNWAILQHGLADIIEVTEASIG